LDYKGSDFNSRNSLDDEPSYVPTSEKPSIPPLLNILSNRVDQINKIVDD